MDNLETLATLDIKRKNKRNITIYKKRKTQKSSAITNISSQPIHAL